MSEFIGWIQRTASQDDREAFIIFLLNGRVQIGDQVFTDIMEFIPVMEAKYDRFGKQKPA